MPQFSFPAGTPGAPDLDSLQRAQKDTTAQLASLQSQLNTGASYFGVTGGKFANGAPPGSLTARQLSDGSIGLSVAHSKGFGGEVVVSNPVTPSYQPLQSDAGAPTLTQFPDDGDYGWYLNTSNSRYYWTLNDSGSLVFQHIRTLTGTISGTQHGDLSADAAAIHAFTQVTGTITDAQHGDRGGDTLHAEATTSVAGFLSASDKTKLDNITSTGAASFNINGTALRVQGTRVVSARDTGWSITGTYTPTKALSINGATISTAQLADVVYTIAQALITHGLLGT